MRYSETNEIIIDFSIDRESICNYERDQSFSDFVENKFDIFPYPKETIGFSSKEGTYYHNLSEKNKDILNQVIHWVNSEENNIEFSHLCTR
jgi:RAB protein geranylgeranyltransferase component A